MHPLVAKVLRRCRIAIGLSVMGWLTCVSGSIFADDSDERLAALPEVFADQFDRGADDWEPTDPRAWRIVDSRRGKAYSLFRQSDFKPPHRSPLNFSLIKGVVVADFVLEADVLSTVKDYDHRDMCVIFDYQDPAHFYYVHFGKKTDDHANQVFIVNDAARRKISLKTTPGTSWDDRWHHVKISRDAQSGMIAVYFDDMQTPVMTAQDKSFTSGRIGLGSFDDVGDWDNVTLRATKVDRAPSRASRQ